MLINNVVPLPKSSEVIDDSLPMLDAQTLWKECLAIICTRVNGQSFKTWFEPIVPLRLENNSFHIRVPSAFFYEWLEEHYYSLIAEIVTQILRKECAITYEIQEEELQAETSMPSDSVIHRSVSSFSQTADSSPNTKSHAHGTMPPLSQTLNSRYTFDNYIKGESNQFARAAAYAVANNPGGTSFNPLVIYGGVGLGKTHLVHAIGNHLIQQDKSRRVLYTSSEKFTVDFVEAIQKDSVTAFSNFYRSVDLLIVDDIQFFSGKEKTQDVFFHTFNTLHQSGKQIVLSSDRPPKDLQGLNERLISRFQWGLTADIQPPDLETRIAILRKKTEDEDIDLPHNVLEFVASNVTSNIRELEGCLIGLLARASLENLPITLQLAKDVVRSIIGEVRTHITIEEIQRVVCEHLKIPEDLLRAKTRKQEIVNARQISMYLAKELTNSSLKTIGLHFGGRDHSTVIHAYQTIEDSLNVDPKQRNLVHQLRSKLELSLHS